MRELILVMIVLLVAFSGVMIAILRIESREDRLEEEEFKGDEDERE